MTVFLNKLLTSYWKRVMSNEGLHSISTDRKVSKHIQLTQLSEISWCRWGKKKKDCRLCLELMTTLVDASQSESKHQYEQN